MKKLVNDVHNVVKETLEGFALAHADLVEVHLDPDFVTRKTPKAEGKVGLVSGGGSGHEPLHAGFVGEGMLDAAVPGAVFTSPTPDPILEATKAADHGAGVLHIVKNYTGDVLNFETAAEMAEMEDIEVRSIVVNDDVAVEDSLYTAGRRGVAGTIFVEKLAGAAAERGDDLDAVTAVAQKTNSEMRSMGLALGPCTVPHAGKPSFWPPPQSRYGLSRRSSSESASTESPDTDAGRWKAPTPSSKSFTRRFATTSNSKRGSASSPSSTEWAAPPPRSCTSATVASLNSSKRMA